MELGNLRIHGKHCSYDIERVTPRELRRAVIFGTFMINVPTVGDFLTVASRGLYCCNEVFSFISEERLSLASFDRAALDLNHVLGMFLRVFLHLLRRHEFRHRVTSVFTSTHVDQKTCSCPRNSQCLKLRVSHPREDCPSFSFLRAGSKRTEVRPGSAHWDWVCCQ
jgi:hypothetical protein